MKHWGLFFKISFFLYETILFVKVLLKLRRSKIVKQISIMAKSVQQKTTVKKHHYWQYFSDFASCYVDIKPKISSTEDL